VSAAAGAAFAFSLGAATGDASAFGAVAAGVAADFAVALGAAADFAVADGVVLAACVEVAGEEVAGSASALDARRNTAGRTLPASDPFARSLPSGLGAQPETRAEEKRPTLLTGTAFPEDCEERKAADEGVARTLLSHHRTEFATNRNIPSSLQQKRDELVIEVIARAND
jgi:hypothetical protein